MELPSCICSIWSIMFSWNCNLYLYILVLLSMVGLEALMLEQLHLRLVLSAFTSVVMHVHFLWCCMTCLDAGEICIALVVHEYCFCGTILVIHWFIIVHREWEGWNGSPILLIWYYFRIVVWMDTNWTFTSFIEICTTRTLYTFDSIHYSDADELFFTWDMRDI